MTVRDIRKAIDGLPDDAPVHLHVLCLGGDAEDPQALIRLVGIGPSGNAAAVAIEYLPLVDDDEQWDDEGADHAAL
jgi:hypothetical protein